VPQDDPADFIARRNGRGGVPMGGRDFLDPADVNGVVLATNDDWQQSPDKAEIQAVGLAPGNGAESALLLPLVRPGQYTAILRGKNGGNGVGLVELFDLP